ncbi:hypothetical protein VZC37_05065 [Gordonia sp. LSe1-13]|uniref:Uncharacterized protein n=1 Tax=Gordonia sesuvii TaxID=3116777 RepID=A0ABU7M9A2_9ACTN|nr:hypothetical protein [Gordonia sp. LSe1-13]
MPQDSVEIVEFALTWAPYGIPPAEAFVTFGLPPQKVLDRMLAAIERFGCDPETLAHLAKSYKR